ncbi:hypothetical protein [Streptomyces sp. NRRL F-2799]|uniref:hypothetical protein n=1 Tax=Streptomyces sp. NRRL F-2799 TaxID=1463844 RepID=UPI0004CB41DA|nr:hypothetical protein [Streptomyces sp. NRRL F-2799]
MTSSLVRGRPRHATAHIRVRVAHALVGAVAGAGWLAIPVVAAQEPATASPPRTAALAAPAAPRDDEPSAVDLILPVAVLGTAGVVAAYSYVRRGRRSSGVVSAAPAAPTPAESERGARAALVQADDSVRASEEELPFAAALLDERTLAPFRHAIHTARTELSAAFALWHRYEEGEPHDPGDRGQALAGVVGRCAEAGRVLDARAGELDRLRWAEAGPAPAVAVAEGAFRRLTARAAGARATVSELRERYGPTVGARVAECVEEAMDRLVFATARLNEARRAADLGEEARSIRQLRAAEGSVAQAGILVAGVDRTARRLREAAALVPAALTGAEAVLAEARATGTPVPSGADDALAAVRQELTAGPYDPLDALRRITRALVRLPGARSGVLDTAAHLVARATTGEAEDFVAVHRGAVGADPRSLLAAAVRTLAAPHPVEGAVLARRALELAERDVRAHGVPESDAQGTSGAVLGGVLLGEEADGGPPVAFGGPQTRRRFRTG